MMPPLRLSLLPYRLAICRLAAEAELPAWAFSGPLGSVTRTGEEVSVLCSWPAVPQGVRREGPFGALKVSGPLDFSLTGILASLAAPLARAEISIFALSTFDTDYVLVREDRLDEALQVLRRAGFEIEVFPG